MRKVERYRNNIMIDGILVHKEKMNSKDERGSSWENNWVKVEPKYYIDKSDDMIYEIWYNRTGIILDRGLNIYIKNDEIATDWTIANLKEINKESAMIKYKERLLKEERLAEIDAKEKQELSNYNNKNLMARIITDGLTLGANNEKPIGWEKLNYQLEGIKSNLKEKDYILQSNKPKYKAGDILKVIGGHDREIGTLFKVKDCMTRYRAEDVELYTELPEPSFDEWTKTKSESIDAMKYNIENYKLYMSVDFGNDEKKGCNAEPIKQQNNGGSSDWYLLPNNARTLQDLIEHRNMNGAVKDIFKACYRLGIKTEDELRDLNKTAYYALREIGRVTGRKDYITIAKELIGSQAIEKE